MKVQEVAGMSKIHDQVDVGFPSETTETGPVDPFAHRVFAGLLAHRLEERADEDVLIVGYLELAEHDMQMAEADLQGTLDVWPD